MTSNADEQEAERKRRNNAVNQATWRMRRNARAAVLTGTPAQIADGILRHLGVEMSAKVARALMVRVRRPPRNAPP
jgi:hypothetical protein